MNVATPGNVAYLLAMFVLKRQSLLSTLGLATYGAWDTNSPSDPTNFIKPSWVLGHLADWQNVALFKAYLIPMRSNFVNMKHFGTSGAIRAVLSGEEITMESQTTCDIEAASTVGVLYAMVSNKAGTLRWTKREAILRPTLSSTKTATVTKDYPDPIPPGYTVAAHIATTITESYNAVAAQSFAAGTTGERGSYLIVEVPFEEATPCVITARQVVNRLIYGDRQYPVASYYRQVQFYAKCEKAFVEYDYREYEKPDGITRAYRDEWFLIQEKESVTHEWANCGLALGGSGEGLMLGAPTLTQSSILWEGWELISPVYAVVGWGI